MASDESDGRRCEDPGAEHPPISQSDLRRYITEAIKRERERLAHIYEQYGMYELAAEIRDETQDEAIFRWDEPHPGPDDPPSQGEQHGP